MTRFPFLGPLILWTWEPVSWGCRDTQSAASACQLEASGGCVELMYLQIATVHRLLKEMLAMVGRDVLQPARVSPKTDRRGFFT
jgi:hypothetical protein